MKIKSHRLTKDLGLAAITGILALPITDGIAIFFHPGYNPFTNSVSDLALGPAGWIQGIGLYLGGIGVMACALGLSLELSRQWEVRLGEVLLSAVGFGIILAAIFHTDLPGHASTLQGKVHGWASFGAGVLALPALFLISSGIRSRKPLFIYTIIAAILQIILEVGRGRLPSDWVFFGLHERLLGANGFIWILVISWAILVKR
jgi:hypothetical membrane protein